MKLESLKDFYIEQLQDMHSSEKQLTEALPKLAKAATSKDLQRAFQDHLKETEQHLRTVEEILQAMGEKPSRKKCKAMQGLVEEGSEVIEAEGDGDARDAALILAAQKAEHYEIATYGGLVTFAEMLGEDDAVDRLQDILHQEKVADEKLTDLATGRMLATGINEKAQK